jgi:predicted transcriptional regulator of viral defense system
MIEKMKSSIEADVFTETAVVNALGGSSDSRYGLVKRALRQGEIIRLKRGLYAFGSKHQRKGINLYQVAQMIYGPSYISLESALAHHGWIPEAVFSVTSVSFRRSREVKTSLGIFSYTHIPSNDFLVGVQRENTDDSVFLMATPWRALADYVYVHKLAWTGLGPVIESLRVDPACFKGGGAGPLLGELKRATRSERVRAFLDGVKKELKP